nr:MAG TPA: hypothetical protein [Bacteriophage sp.]
MGAHGSGSHLLSKLLFFYLNKINIVLVRSINGSRLKLYFFDAESCI